MFAFTSIHSQWSEFKFCKLVPCLCVKLIDSAYIHQHHTILLSLQNIYLNNKLFDWHLRRFHGNSDVQCKWKRLIFIRSNSINLAHVYIWLKKVGESRVMYTFTVPTMFSTKKDIPISRMWIKYYNIYSHADYTSSCVAAFWPNRGEKHRYYGIVIENVCPQWQGTSIR